MSREQEGIIYTILDGMHPNIKAIVFSILAVPLVISASGMLLQVNVGSIIQKVVDESFKEPVAYMAQMEASVNSINEQLFELKETQDRQLKITADKLDVMDKDITMVKDWLCGYSTRIHKRPDFCAEYEAMKLMKEKQYETP